MFHLVLNPHLYIDVEPLAALSLNEFTTLTSRSTGMEKEMVIHDKSLQYVQQSLLPGSTNGF